MDLQGDDSKTILQAQAHVYKHSMGYSTGVSLRCVIQLRIPDIINNHGRPITLSELVSALQINPKKSGFIYRLMRHLAFHGFFNSTKNGKTKEETYTLTPSSRLLLKCNNHKGPSLSQFFDLVLNPFVFAPCHVLEKWLLQEDTPETPFEFFHGKNLWDHMEKNPEHQRLMDEGMDCDSSFFVFLVKELKQVFEGVSSFVEVGGGRGEFSKIILDTIPHLNCTVLDLPHVVADLSDTPNMKFVSGDMFEAIPPGDVILLKVILHSWNDEQCVKILKNCRESMRGSTGRAKVIIIDIVLNENEDESELLEAKLNYDLMGMVLTNGKERSKNDWQKLIADAGFSGCKITATDGIKSLIEAFP